MKVEFDDLQKVRVVNHVLHEFDAGLYQITSDKQEYKRFAAKHEKFFAQESEMSESLKDWKSKLSHIL